MKGGIYEFRIYVLSNIHSNEQQNNMNLKVCVVFIQHRFHDSGIEIVIDNKKADARILGYKGFILYTCSIMSSFRGTLTTMELALRGLLCLHLSGSVCCTKSTNTFDLHI